VWVKSEPIKKRLDETYLQTSPWRCKIGPDPVGFDLKGQRPGTPEFNLSRLRCAEAAPKHRAMATDEGTSQQIYDLAGNCEDLFGDLLSVLSRTSDRHYRIVQEHQQRFERWTGYLGVFAAPQASLDSRLKSDPDIRDLVIQLLEILERNIQHGESLVTGW
jgi:hypothetical protein